MSQSRDDFDYDNIVGELDSLLKEYSTANIAKVLKPAIIDAFLANVFDQNMTERDSTLEKMAVLSALLKLNSSSTEERKNFLSKITPFFEKTKARLKADSPMFGQSPLINFCSYVLNKSDEEKEHLKKTYKGDILILLFHYVEDYTEDGSKNIDALRKELRENIADRLGASLLEVDKLLKPLSKEEKDDNNVKCDSAKQYPTAANTAAVLKSLSEEKDNKVFNDDYSGIVRGFDLALKQYSTANIAEVLSPITDDFIHKVFNQKPFRFIERDSTLEKMAILSALLKLNPSSTNTEECKNLLKKLIQDFKTIKTTLEKEEPNLKFCPIYKLINFCLYVLNISNEDKENLKNKCKNDILLMLFQALKEAPEQINTKLRMLEIAMRLGVSYEGVKAQLKSLDPPPSYDNNEDQDISPPQYNAANP